MVVTECFEMEGGQLKPVDRCEHLDKCYCTMEVQPLVLNEADTDNYIESVLIDEE